MARSRSFALVCPLADAGGHGDHQLQEAPDCSTLRGVARRVSSEQRWRSVVCLFLFFFFFFLTWHAPTECRQGVGARPEYQAHHQDDRSARLARRATTSDGAVGASGVDRDDQRGARSGGRFDNCTGFVALVVNRSSVASRRRSSLGVVRALLFCPNHRQQQLAVAAGTPFSSAKYAISASGRRTVAQPSSALLAAASHMPPPPPSLSTPATVRQRV